MTEELKPCPCSRPASLSHADSAGRKSIACGDQDCRWIMSGLCEEVLIAAWNRRETNDIALLSLLADIRKAAGDPTGKLMQSELVDHIAGLLDVSKCSQTTQSLIRMLIERDQLGRAKYGKTLDRADLTHAEWLRHMAEEMLDGAGYALAAKRTA